MNLCVLPEVKQNIENFISSESSYQGLCTHMKLAQTDLV
jgi:hypothetical protein